jgi:hypothetical protein
MNLGKKLSMLSNSGHTDAELAGVVKPSPRGKEVKDDDIDDSPDLEIKSISISSYLSESGYSGSKKKKKKTSSIFDDIDTSRNNDDLAEITRRTRRLAEMADLANAEEFDSFMSDEELFTAEENTELKESLLSLGRKYARDSAISKESSEISRTFAESEKRLKALYEELNEDKKNLQTDINRLRLPRGGTTKSLADMISVKNALQSTQLQIVKELNGLRKTMFELRAKEEARKQAENTGSTDITSNTIQSLFANVRSEAMTSLGGYTEVSGSHSNRAAEDLSPLYREPDDEEIQRTYFSGESSYSDGDKFLEYEDRGVQYVVLIDESDKVVEVLAEDRDGILIPDYPMPSNIDRLSFKIDKTTMTAEDSLHRNYLVRYWILCKK